MFNWFGWFDKAEPRFSEKDIKQALGIQPGAAIPSDAKSKEMLKVALDAANKYIDTHPDKPGNLAEAEIKPPGVISRVVGSLTSLPQTIMNALVPSAISAVAVGGLGYIAETKFDKEIPGSGKIPPLTDKQKKEMELKSDGKFTEKDLDNILSGRTPEDRFLSLAGIVGGFGLAVSTVIGTATQWFRDPTPDTQVENALVQKLLHQYYYKNYIASRNGKAAAPAAEANDAGDNAGTDVTSNDVRVQSGLPSLSDTMTNTASLF